MLQTKPATAATATPASSASPAPLWRWGGGYEAAIRLAKNARSECFGNPDAFAFWEEYISRLLRQRVLPFLPGQTPEPVTLVPLRFITASPVLTPGMLPFAFHVCLEDSVAVFKVHVGEACEGAHKHLVDQITWVHQGRALFLSNTLASYGVKPGDTLVAIPRIDGA